MLVDILRTVLEFFYGITASYGTAIILMSLTVSTAMLPIFWITEWIQARERHRKEAMKPMLEQISDVENKKEKYYYTREIYRQNKYNPFFALSGLLGLFIQVPFFLAAYWLLLEYAPIIGVSYGPINDLSKADELLSLGGISANLLPLIMTIINLVGAYFHARTGDRSERVLLVTIAIFFLFFLYKLSAGLVLYWTASNAFAVGKNLIMTRMVSKKIQESSILPQRQDPPFVRLRGLLSFAGIPCLAATIPLLSIFQANIGELEFQQIWPLALFIVISTLGASLVFHAVLKNKSKAALYTYVAIILFFSYGYLDEMVRGQGLNGHQAAVTLGLACLLFFFGFGYYIYKTNLDFTKTVKALSVLTICLSSIIAFRIAIYNVAQHGGNHSTSSARKVIRDAAAGQATNNSDPDIYFIVLDGYANSKILKELLQFDNSSFENALMKNGFYIAPDSRCNYVTTFLSLAATLNMEHLTHLGNTLGGGTKDRTIANQLISDNLVLSYLQNRGYISVHFGSGWGATRKNNNFDINLTSGGSIDEFTTLFFQTTMLLPVINSIASHNYPEHIIYTLDNLSKLEQTEGPKFVFAHIVCPHPPYVFNEDGTTSSRGIQMNNSWGTIESRGGDYIKQLKFLNAKLLSFVDQVQEQSQNPIIILQSDHGSAFLAEDWNEPSIGFLNERGRIFNAILPSKSFEQSPSPSITAVNTFRVIFNQTFNEEYELLEDETFYSSYDNPYSFKNITDILNRYLHK